MKTIKMDFTEYEQMNSTINELTECLKKIEDNPDKVILLWHESLRSSWMVFGYEIDYIVPNVLVGKEAENKIADSISHLNAVSKEISNKHDRVYKELQDLNANPPDNYPYKTIKRLQNWAGFSAVVIFILLTIILMNNT